MAEASLNFNEEELKKDKALYALYLKYYDGMVSANEVTPPDYTTSPPLTEDGQIDSNAIAEGLKNYSDILLKNSAYLMSTAVQFALNGSGGGEGGEGGGIYLRRSGDSMQGNLEAKYGFVAGADGKTMLSTSSSQITLSGRTVFSGEYFQIKGSKLLFGDQIEMSNNGNQLNILGNVVLGSDYYFTLGQSKITKDGVYVSDNLVYHKGNANLATVNWDMQDAHVYGNTIVDKNITINGVLYALNGFDFRYNDNKLLGTVVSDNSQFINLYTDLVITPNFGIKSGDKYVLKKYTGENDYVCLSAPDSILHLGGADGDSLTQAIVLKSDIYNYSKQYKIVSQNGDGNFPNSLSAGCANAGPTVLRTYYTASDNCGVEFLKRIRIGQDGISLYSQNEDLVFDFPASTEHLSEHKISMSIDEITTLFTPSNTATAIKYHSTTDVISFDQPLHISELQISSNKYKTRIIENAFFFNDGLFLEGLSDGIRYSGNSYFDGDLTSRSFSPGFLGYGFGIVKNEALGGVEAHFDGLVVRKKMKVYELEVQKQSVVNGSWFISNSCSGDLVEELN